MGTHEVGQGIMEKKWEKTIYASKHMTVKEFWAEMYWWQAGNSQSCTIPNNSSCIWRKKNVYVEKKSLYVGIQRQSLETHLNTHTKSINNVRIMWKIK